MPVLVYKTDAETGEYVGVSQRFAWGPDLSSSLGGAGGIGGMAVYIDEAWDNENSSAAAGPMMVVYDGNGNLTRLYDTSFGASGGSVDARARYEYGPFGEALSLFGGELALRNPIRWSTKWTDAETGLVYYGYRYYSASTGRWLARDPAGEMSYPDLYVAMRNGAVQYTDPFGLFDTRCDPCDTSANRGQFYPQTFTKSEWQQQSRSMVGINEAMWPRLGVASPIVTAKELAKLYSFYGTMYYLDNRFLWAGGASLVGRQLIPSIYGLDELNCTYPGMCSSTRRLMVEMAQSVFDDLGWQHLAFFQNGIQEIRAHFDRKEITDRTFRGWCKLASRDPRKVYHGNVDLVWHEQFIILQPQWNKLRAGIVGGAIAHMVGTMAAAPFDGAPSFHQWVPGGDFTNQVHRWAWIQEVLFRWEGAGSENRNFEVATALAYYQAVLVR